MRSSYDDTSSSSCSSSDSYYEPMQPNQYRVPLTKDLGYVDERPVDFIFDPDARDSWHSSWACVCLLADESKRSEISAIHLERATEELYKEDCKLSQILAENVRDNLMLLAREQRFYQTPEAEETQKKAKEILGRSPVLNNLEPVETKDLVEKIDRDRKRLKTQDFIREEKKKAVEKIPSDKKDRLQREWATAAIVHDLRERFPQSLPMRYVTQRPELRWEWFDSRKNEVKREVLIGGGANSDLEKF